jgi:serine/threonine protein phosphatase 1
MKYVISDLHGRYDLYRKMLEKINLTSRDTLYILGDFVDRGEEGIRIIFDAFERDNVIPFMGNHDFTVLSILSQIQQRFHVDNFQKVKELIDVWMFNGGQTTYEEFKNLPAEDRRKLIWIMDHFRYFAEVRAGGNQFVLCHAGLQNYHPEKPLSSYSVDELLFTREDYSKPKFGIPGKYLVTGHTPTALIEGGIEGRIYKNHDHIAIDCGAVFGYGLGCLRLDDMEEFYVK